MRQYKWSQSSLWRFGICHELQFKFIFLCIENMSNTWYNIILLLTIYSNVKLFVPYSNYNINEARSLTIVIGYNKTKWKHDMTKTSFRWPNKWCVEFSLQHHKNIFHVVIIFFDVAIGIPWIIKSIMSMWHEHSIKKFLLFMKLSSHVHSSCSCARHSRSWAHMVVLL
jgi:hypothetical protein